MSNESHDTKPTIETVLERINELGTRIETRIDGLDARIGGLETRFENLENRVGSLENAITELRDEVHRGFRDFERRIEVMTSDIVKLRGEMRYIHDRIDKIEKAG